MVRQYVHHLIALSLGLQVAWGVALSEGRGVAETSGPTATAQQFAYLPLIQQTCAPVELVQDGGFEAGLPNPAWQTSSNVFSDILDDTPDPAPHGGAWKAWLGGDDLIQESLWQTITVPAGTVGLQVSYWWRVDTFETVHPYDTLEVQIRDAAGNPVQTLETLTDGDAGPDWQQSVFTVTQSYAGQTIQLVFVGQTDDSNPTSFFVDDVSVLKTCPAGLAADVTGDCRVTAEDLQETAAHWRETRGSACYAEPYDQDGNGRIDVVDVMQVAAQWQP